MIVKQIKDFTIHMRDWPASDHLVGDEILVNNTYLFNPNDIKYGLVIDIGANIGVFTVLAGRYAHVESYEPESNNYNLLCQNIETNKSNAIPFKLAVGKSGVSTINDLQGCSQLGAPGEEVAVISINNILNKFKNIDFLKIDCEGSEYDILEDITHDNLSKCEHMGIEFHPLWTDIYKTTVVEDGQNRYEEIIKKLNKTHYKNDNGYHWYKRS